MGNIIDLVRIERNKNYGLVVSSRVIAKALNRRHKNIIRDIDKICESSISSNLSQLIFTSKYKDSRNRNYREYLLTKDGFILYMFNIQGHNKFKISYINEFNRMEKALNERKENETKVIQIEAPKKLTFRGEIVITLSQLSEILGKDRETIGSKLEHKNIISGNDLREFKSENQGKKYMSCLTILNKDEAVQVAERIKNVSEESKQELMRYFIPDMESIKDSRHWRRIKDMQSELCVSGKVFFAEVKKLEESIEKLKELKMQILAYIQFMNYDIHELEK
ncbi:phage regulatory protein, Rha family [Leptotrichia wadei]|jgi:phage regulatory protein, rha family|uniref:Phage regulatory protein, Rha family n=1 Tax=Leptotrichia wadei TaxID=157687 RepID=A0A134ARJ0_9FUSO|nr:Rha family transcriptional regulator [Leptotrichia wadei]KXB70296.1 phage regulatory protein, Rha family [Leptotrichia wadei]DAS04831.1 MAG TPA: regulatory protein [Caudoviricetes sp.]